MTDSSDARKAELATLWGEGVSTAEIGRRMKISKNAVVGKAHRLNLPPRRPSPLKQLAQGERKAAKPRHEKPQAPKLTFKMPDGPPPKAPPVPDKISQRSITCCWPIGLPGTASFRFCDAASVPGRAYCQNHCNAAYVRRGDVA